MGAVKELTISDLEKRITAYHEAGHTLTAWELPGADPIYKVSIIPRGMAMGVTQLLPGRRPALLSPHLSYEQVEHQPCRAGRGKDRV